MQSSVLNSASTIWQTVGHIQAKVLLEKLLSGNKLPPVLLFIGPAGVGKKTLLLEFFTRAVENTLQSSNPDYGFLDAGTESGLSNLKSFLQRNKYHPVRQKYQVMVIDNLECLSLESHNALLKTLEEPGERTCFGLIANTRNLPRTLLSRCLVIKLKPLSSEDLVKLCADSLLVEPQLEQLMEANGSFSELTANLTVQNYRALYLPLAKRLIGLGSGISQRLFLHSELSLLETGQLQKVLQICLNLQKHRVAKGLVNSSKLEVLTSALRQLKANVNKKLIIQSLIVSI